MVKAPLNSLPRQQLALPKPLWVTWFSSVLLLVVVGGTLFLFPEMAQRYWPWTLAPFNTRLLGAIYASAAIPLMGYLVRPRLDYLRLVLPVFACFTTYFLLVSMGHVDSFLARKSSGIWFFLYGADSFVGLFYCWRLRQHLLWRREDPNPWSSLYRIQALILGGYGLGLLVAASLFGKWWPWPLDSFHSHLYSGVFLSAVLAMELLRDRASADGRRWFGLTQLCLGGLIVLGNWIVDLKIEKLDWVSWSPWFWQGVFLGFAGLGVWGWVQGVSLAEAVSSENSSDRDSVGF